MTVFMIISGNLFASYVDYKSSPWTDEYRATDRIIRKIGFSAKNFFFGWSEPIYHFYTAFAKGNNIVEAALVGGWYGLADTAGGLLQGLTFPFSFDIKLPEGGTHMFKDPAP